MHLPCGRCYPCTMRRVSGWSFRLVQEDKRAYSSSFLTLTYNTKHVPLSKKGFMTLRKQIYNHFLNVLDIMKRNTAIELIQKQFAY